MIAGGPPPRWRLSVHDELTSTSDLCRDLAEQGEPAWRAVLARRQSQGRGSRGRSWATPSGNLAISVLLRPAIPVREAGQMSLLAGVALARALAEQLPKGAPLALKWPNDVLLDGRKLAGILLDSKGDGAGRLEWMVIGLGANLAAAPEVPGRRTACIADFAPAPSAEAVGWRVLAWLADLCDVQERHGFAPIRAAWSDLAQHRGSPMSLRLGDATVSGHFAGLGQDGSLLLDVDGERRCYRAGEVLLQNGD